MRRQVTRGIKLPPAAKPPKAPKALALQRPLPHALRVDASGIVADNADSAIAAARELLRDAAEAARTAAPWAPPPISHATVTRDADGTYSVTVDLRYHAAMDPQKTDLGATMKAAAQLAGQRTGAAVRQGGPDIVHRKPPANRPPKKPKPKPPTK